jgi:hypothetical protein
MFSLQLEEKMNFFNYQYKESRVEILRQTEREIRKREGDRETFQIKKKFFWQNITKKNFDRR